MSCITPSSSKFPLRRNLFKSKEDQLLFVFIFDDLIDHTKNGRMVSAKNVHNVAESNEFIFLLK